VAVITARVIIIVIATVTAMEKAAIAAVLITAISQPRQ
jgi:hypothetical protein